MLWVCTKVFKDDLDDLDLSVPSDLAVSFDVDVVTPLGASWCKALGIRPSRQPAGSSSRKAAGMGKGHRRHSNVMTDDKLLQGTG